MIRSSSGIECGYTTTTPPIRDEDAMCSDVLKKFSEFCSYGTEIVSADCNNGTQMIFVGWFTCFPAYCNEHYTLYWEKFKVNTLMVRIKHSVTHASNHAIIPDRSVPV